MNIEQVVLNAFAEVVKGKEITKDMKIKDLGIDSLDLVESLMSMESELDIEFTDEEMMSFTTVGDVYKVVEAKLSSK